MTRNNAAPPCAPCRKNGKRTAAAVLAAVVTAALLLGGFALYCYLTPDIRIAVGKPVDPNAQSYVQRPMVSVSTKLGMPLPPRLAAHEKEFWQANNTVITQFYEEYGQPLRIDASVRIVDGQTLVTYSGTVTDKTGAQVEYDEQLVFDFILTKNIS